VFWLTRPPYLRWAAAALLLIAALAWDLRGRSGVPYPFAAQPIAAGTVIGEADVEWCTMPGGALTMPDLSAPIAARAIPAGEPILPSAVDPDAGIPAGWWAVSVALPAAAAVGSGVRLIATDTRVESEGIVVAAGSADLLSISDAGLVAVPPERATAIATAAAAGTLIVLIEP
jgi:Flp pilus assembly protein CpaB